MNALSEILLTHMLELLVEVSSVFSRIDQTPICKWWGNGSFIIILPMEHSWVIKKTNSMQVLYLDEIDLSSVGYSTRNNSEAN